MRIAIVSTDGVNVNDHFGKAERFLIYEADPQGLTPLAEQRVSRLSTGDKDHSFDPVRFAPVAEALAGCRKVYATRIGDRPRRELEKLGITAVIYEGAIAAIIAGSDFC